MQLTPNFRLAEFLPNGWAEKDVPTEVLINLERTAILLELGRAAVGAPLVVHSGWRPPANNEAVGGVPTSDHLAGRAADVHVDLPEWELATVSLFHWYRDNARGRFGQVILEDHRLVLNDPGQLWVHVAVTSGKHSGGKDSASVLVSLEPGKYMHPEEALG